MRLDKWLKVSRLIKRRTAASLGGRRREPPCKRARQGALRPPEFTSGGPDEIRGPRKIRDFAGCAF